MSWREFTSYPIISQSVTGSLTYGSTTTTWNQSDPMRHHLKMPFLQILTQPSLFIYFFSGSIWAFCLILIIQWFCEKRGWLPHGKTWHELFSDPNSQVLISIIFIFVFFIEFIIVIRIEILDQMNDQARKDRGCRVVVSW